MWHKTLQEALNSEKSKYIENHIYTERTDEPGMFFGSAPRQLNIQIGERDGETLYKVEFMEDEGTWSDATTWLSGADATKAFIECEAEKLDISWFNPEWTTKIE